MKTLKIQLPEEVLNFVYRHGFVAEEHRDIVNKAILEGEDCFDDWKEVSSQEAIDTIKNYMED